MFIYVGANAFVLILSFVPANLPDTVSKNAPTLPWYTGPVAGLGVIAFGILWWAWDRHVLKRLGYHFWFNENWYFNDHWKIDALRVNYYVSCLSRWLLVCSVLRKQQRELDGVAGQVFEFCQPSISWCWRLLRGEGL